MKFPAPITPTRTVTDKGTSSVDTALGNGLLTKPASKIDPARLREAASFLVSASLRVSLAARLETRPHRTRARV